MRNGKEEIRLIGRGNGISLIAFRNMNTASSSRCFSSLLHLRRVYRVYKFIPIPIVMGGTKRLRKSRWFDVSILIERPLLGWTVRCLKIPETSKQTSYHWYGKSRVL